MHEADAANKQNPSDASASAKPGAGHQADLASAVKELQALNARMQPLVNFIQNQKPPEAMEFGGILGGRAGANADQAYFDPSPLQLPTGLWKPELGRDQQLALVRDELRKRHNAFTTKWLELERKHPALAMYRDGNGAPKDLSALQKGGKEQQQAIVRAVLPKLRDILRARGALRGDSGEKLDPLKLPGAVAASKRYMMVMPGSMQDRLATDAMEDAMDGGWKDWAIAALAVGLAIVTAAGTGGSSVALSAELSGLALDMYMADDAIKSYRLETGLSNTSMDKARALSTKEPSLTWLVVDLFSVGLDMHSVAKLLDQAIALKSAVKAGDLPTARVIRDGLETAGETHGASGLGKRAYDDAIGDPDLARDLRHAEGPEFELSVRGKDDVAKEKQAAKHAQNPKRRTSTADRPLSPLAEGVPGDMEAFQAWFDALTYTDFMKFWNDVDTPTHQGAKTLIAKGIRFSGFTKSGTRAAGKHEWLKVSQIPKIKQWGLPMDLVHDARTFTSRTAGKTFKHGGKGSNTMHRALDEMFEVSESLDDFKQLLNDFADREMGRNGRAHLPRDLRLSYKEHPPIN